MKTKTSLALVAAAASLGGLYTAPALASSHREAPGISTDPSADNTDLYAWVCDQEGVRSLCLVANYIPLQLPEGGPNFNKFSNDVLYQIHVTHNDAQGNPFVVPGPRGIKFFAGPRDDAFFVNLAQVFDLGAFVGLNVLNNQPFRSQQLDVDPNANGQFANTDPTQAPDGVAGLNVHSIALALPLAELAPDNDPGFLAAVDAGQPSNQTLFGVWASASRRAARVACPPNQAGTAACPNGALDVGPWRQVSRIGLPLINEVVIGIQDKDKFNRTTPVDDVNNFGVYFLNPVLVRDVEAVGGFARLGVDPVPDDLKFGRVDILDVINLNVIPVAGAHQVEIANGRTGDVLRVDVALDSAFPNGRPLSGAAVAAGKEEDVTDIELSLILTKLTAPVTDFVGGPGDGRKLLNEFPYLGLPFAGDIESKGTPAAF